MPAAMADDVREPIDAALTDLAAGARTWANLTLSQLVTLFRSLRRGVAASAREWANCCGVKRAR